MFMHTYICVCVCIYSKILIAGYMHFSDRFSSFKVEKKPEPNPPTEHATVTAVQSSEGPTALSQREHFVWCPKGQIGPQGPESEPFSWWKL